MTIYKSITLLCAGSLLAISGCRTAYEPPSDFQMAYRTCIADTADLGVTGNYVVSQTEREPNGHPTVKAGPGGNRRGEVIMNGCIAQRVRTDGAQPATASKAPAPARGKLPLPTEYALQPGDAELWPTLTRAQQDRALQFLKAGSTIRSSMASE